MRAVDTNVVVRLLAKDHPEQSARAFAVFGGGDTWVPVTVMLETEWVLRSAYRSEPRKIVALFRSMFGIPGVAVENAAAVTQALDWYEHGMDFADALHLATAQGCDGFATFDRDFIKTAARLGAGRVAEP
jgi:predicted nucleic-acid-binding protein